MTVKILQHSDWSSQQVESLLNCVQTLISVQSLETDGAEPGKSRQILTLKTYNLLVLHTSKLTTLTLWSCLLDFSNMDFQDYAFSMPTCYQLGIPNDNSPLTQYQPYHHYAPQVTMPIPHPLYDYNLEPAFIRKRNERERIRVRHVNEGYARLREHLPEEPTDKRMSKVETLRAAIRYIKHLESLLETETPKTDSIQKEQQKSS